MSITINIPGRFIGFNGLDRIEEGDVAIVDVPYIGFGCFNTKTSGPVHHKFLGYSKKKFGNKNIVVIVTKKSGITYPHFRPHRNCLIPSFIPDRNYILIDMPVVQCYYATKRILFISGKFKKYPGSVYNIRFNNDHHCISYGVYEYISRCIDLKYTIDLFVGHIKFENDDHIFTRFSWRNNGDLVEDPRGKFFAVDFYIEPDPNQRRYFNRKTVCTDGYVASYRNYRNDGCNINTFYPEIKFNKLRMLLFCILQQNVKAKRNNKENKELDIMIKLPWNLQEIILEKMKINLQC